MLVEIDERLVRIVPVPELEDAIPGHYHEFTQDSCAGCRFCEDRMRTLEDDDTSVYYWCRNHNFRIPDVEGLCDDFLEAYSADGEDEEEE